MVIVMVIRVRIVGMMRCYLVSMSSFVVSMIEMIVII